MVRNLHVLDLGREKYAPALSLQERMVTERRDGHISDSLILVEHDPVYTLGRNADRSNVIKSDSELDVDGIEVVSSTRGGDVTYHGPGQLVGYPIISLLDAGRSLTWYIDGLEQMLIRTLVSYGVDAGTDSINRGVWVGKDKICAIGVRVARSITMHGFSFNVCPDMSHYNGIIPCGIKGRGVTSLDKFVPDVGMADVKQRIIHYFKEVFLYASN